MALTFIQIFEICFKKIVLMKENLIFCIKQLMYVEIKFCEKN